MRNSESISQRIVDRLIPLTGIAKDLQTCKDYCEEKGSPISGLIFGNQEVTRTVKRKEITSTRPAEGKMVMLDANYMIISGHYQNDLTKAPFLLIADINDINPFADPNHIYDSRKNVKIVLVEGGNLRNPKKITYSMNQTFDTGNEGAYGRLNSLDSLATSYELKPKNFIKNQDVNEFGGKIVRSAAEMVKRRFR